MCLCQPVEIQGNSPGGTLVRFIHLNIPHPTTTTPSHTHPLPCLPQPLLQKSSIFTFPCKLIFLRWSPALLPPLPGSQWRGLKSSSLQYLPIKGAHHVSGPCCTPAFVPLYTAHRPLLPLHAAIGFVEQLVFRGRGMEGIHGVSDGIFIRGSVNRAGGVRG